MTKELTIEQIDFILGVLQDFHDDSAYRRALDGEDENEFQSFVEKAAKAYTLLESLKEPMAKDPFSDYSEKYPLSQKFLVYFEKQSYDGLQVMSLADLIDMYKVFSQLTYPRSFDVSNEDYDEIQINSFHEMRNCFETEPIEEVPIILPQYTHIGFWPQWEHLWEEEE